jgi:hypothetical protein
MKNSGGDRVDARADPLPEPVTDVTCLLDVLLNELEEPVVVEPVGVVDPVAELLVGDPRTITPRSTTRRRSAASPGYPDPPSRRSPGPSLAIAHKYCLNGGQGTEQARAGRGENAEREPWAEAENLCRPETGHQLASV